MGRLVEYLGAVRTVDFSSAADKWTDNLVVATGQMLSLIGFALAAIFPATIWLMPQRVPATVVPAAIGFMTSVAGLGQPLSQLVGWALLVQAWKHSSSDGASGCPDGGSASLASATCTLK